MWLKENDIENENSTSLGVLMVSRVTNKNK